MGGQRYLRRAPRGVVEAAKGHRKGMTAAESVLWAALRRRQLGGLRFRKQHPIGPFILDFYCHERRLAIEVDGAVHEEPTIHEHDRSRTLSLQAEEITVLRVTNSEVLHDLPTVLARIEAANAHPP